VHAAPFIPERRASAYVGWILGVLATAGAAAMAWLWWNRGGEIAALNTDLTAAYAELETLRARPMALPVALPDPVVPDPNAAAAEAALLAATAAPVESATVISQPEASPASASAPAPDTPAANQGTTSAPPPSQLAQ
jgi:hypothetical protein